MLVKEMLREFVWTCRMGCFVCGGDGLRCDWRLAQSCDSGLYCGHLDEASMERAHVCCCSGPTSCIRLVSGAAPATIDDVVQTMESIDQLLPDGDGLKWFNRLYMMVTKEVDLHPPAGGWKDAEWLLLLDVVFAGLYFKAVAEFSAMGWEYVTAGAGDELTVRWNKEAYQRIRLRPHVLVDVSKLDTRVTLFGQEHPFPILLAPTASQKLTHPEGELATARGAGAAGTTMVLSSFSNTSLEDVAAVAKSPLWFQLYAQTDHGFTRELVERAEAGGYRALCLTVDSPISGARNREQRADVKLGPLPNLKGLQTFSGVLDAALSWKDVEWLLSFCQDSVAGEGCAQSRRC